MGRHICCAQRQWDNQCSGRLHGWPRRDSRNSEQPRGTIGTIITCMQHLPRYWLVAEAIKSLVPSCAAQTTLQGNIFCNGPRAAFKFNDGFGGGDDISGNLLLNCVRESSDHGPWNSWSRVPDTTTIRAGKPSIVPATRKIRGRAKELLPPDDRFQGFRHENESFIILFYMV